MICQAKRPPFLLFLLLFLLLPPSFFRTNTERREQGLPETTELPPAYTLGAAAFSKFVATTTTYPHEVVRTR